MKRLIYLNSRNLKYSQYYKLYLPKEILTQLDTELLKLLIPLGLIAGGIYLKNAKNEPNASKHLWKILIIVGAISFIIKLLVYLNRE